MGSPWYVETSRALALHQRLAILREADELRMWSSLDHQRVCTFCKKTFTGHEVQIRRVANDKYEVRCPTEGCTSSPQQWEYHGTPPYSNRVDPDWWRPSKRTNGSVAEEVKNGKIRISRKGGRGGKLQTVRHEPVSASLLAEFLKQRRKVEEQEATVAKLQKQVDAINAGLQKLSAQLEVSKSTPQKSVKLPNPNGSSAQTAVTL